MTAQTTVDGGEVLVRCLQAEGVRIIFAIADITYTPVFRSADDKGIRIVGGRHESANVHMADGWARATGDVAVAMGAMGPGVANLVPGVMTASIEGVPVVVVATQRNNRADRSVRRGRFQHTPQIDVFRPITKFAAVVPDARRIPEYVREAFRCALTGRPGPVYLELGDDVLRQLVDDASIQVIPPARYRTTPGLPDPRGIEAAAALLAAARFPMILAGQGVARSGAAEALQALVERTGALVTTTLGARGTVPEDHPQAVVFETPGGAKGAHEADVVLAVGTQVGETVGYGRPPRWAAPDDQRWAHLDSDPACIGVNREVDIALVGDAGAGLTELLKALPERQEPPQAVLDCAALGRSARREATSAIETSDAFPIHPARLSREVADFFDDDAIACFDGGNTTIWSLLFHTFRRPGSLMWTSHFGHLGTGLPYAIAAKLAHPDRPVYLITGDSAFGFNLQELETAAREAADIVVIVNCDYAWGMERLGQQVEMGRSIGVTTSHVRYDEVARGLGCHGEFVDRPGDIRPALERATQAAGPAVVHVEVNPLENICPPGLVELAQMYGAEKS